MIQNFSITKNDFTNSHTVFDPKLSGSKHNTVQQNPDMMVIDYINVSTEFLKWHKFVTIIADAMFANNTPFLITMSLSINIETFGNVHNCTDKKLSKYDKRVI